jgi:hypothetical protein
MQAVAAWLEQHFPGIRPLCLLRNLPIEQVHAHAELASFGEGGTPAPQQMTETQLAEQFAQLLRGGTRVALTATRPGQNDPEVFVATIVDKTPPAAAAAADPALRQYVMRFSARDSHIPFTSQWVHDAHETSFQQLHAEGWTVHRLVHITVYMQEQFDRVTSRLAQECMRAPTPPPVAPAEDPRVAELLLSTQRMQAENQRLRAQLEEAAAAVAAARGALFGGPHEPPSKALEAVIMYPDPGTTTEPTIVNPRTFPRFLSGPHAQPVDVVCDRILNEMRNSGDVALNTEVGKMCVANMQAALFAAACAGEAAVPALCAAFTLLRAQADKKHVDPDRAIAQLRLNIETPLDVWAAAAAKAGVFARGGGGRGRGGGRGNRGGRGGAPQSPQSPRQGGARGGARAL